jgi:hypothetical protein
MKLESRRTHIFEGNTSMNFVDENCEIVFNALNLQRYQREIYSCLNDTYGEILPQALELVADPMVVALCSPSLL